MTAGEARHASLPVVGRRRPPLDERAKIYGEVLRQRKKSYLYREIIEEIQNGFGVRLAKETVSFWVRGLSTPPNAGHQFVPKPTPELAYIIGVETGGGFLNEKRKNYQYRIRLRAVDVEFVEAFNQAVAKVLSCSPHRLWKGEKARETEVEFGSYLLHKFLLQPLEALKLFIEHSKKCVAAFIRGFFDSEGNVGTEGVVSGSNTDLKLLGYVQFLLANYFGIIARGPYLGTKKGSLLVRRGKSYRRNSDCYSIVISKGQPEKFQRNVGMTIEIKRLRIGRILAEQGRGLRVASKIRSKH